MFVHRKIFSFFFPVKLVSSFSIKSEYLSSIQFAVQSYTMSTDGTTNGCPEERLKPLVAIAQMRATIDKASNMKQVEELVSQAKAKNVSMLFLPECCDFVGESRNQTLELAEPLAGPTMRRYQELAKSNSIWISLGGVHEIPCIDANKSEKIYNAHVLLDNNGQIVNVYRKLHLFDVNTKEFKFRESSVVLPGKHLVPPCETPIGSLGLQICYDMRFAETSILLRKMGANILTYPAAFAYNTGKAHWEILLRARAIENQCFVIAPAQVGYHNDKRRSWGHAMIVDPWGKVLANCGGEKDLAIATAEINLRDLQNVRRNMPCFEHRRNDVYSLLSYGNGSLHASKDMKFDKSIIRQETIFYETEHSFAFTNLRCVVNGHVLVSTKRVTPRLSGLNCDEITDLFATVCKIQHMLENFYKTSAATVTVQDGTDAGQTVPHVHFHVMPRRQGDFGHNDQIYVKLEDRCEEKPDRSIEERIAEAQLYRDFMKSRMEKN